MFPEGQGAPPTSIIAIKTKIKTETAVPPRPLTTMMTRKSRRILSQPASNTCSTAVGACRRNYWQWFAQAELDAPVVKQGDYRPGLELDAAAGIDYRDWNWGRVKTAPLAQVIGSVRGRDNGAPSRPMIPAMNGSCSRPGSKRTCIRSNLWGGGMAESMTTSWLGPCWSS